MMSAHEDETEILDDLKKLNSKAWQLAEEFSELRKLIEDSNFDERTKEKLREHFEYPEAAVPLDMWHSALNALWHDITDDAVRTFFLVKGMEQLEDVDEDTFGAEWRS